ncbi:MAG: cobalamin-dependent protein [Proteobacteria bacterium]|nr:cobalamin-dependent protein [Pseudomonadota bacterium]
MNETMTAVERFEATVALEPVDRHPVFPIIMYAAVRLAGETQAAAWADHDLARECLLKAFREYGFDYGTKPNFFWPMLPGRHCAAPVRNLIPGRQVGVDDIHQIDERPLFEREDYDEIAALGWNGFWDEHYQKIKRKSLERLRMAQSFSNKAYIEDQEICRREGLPILVGAAVDSPLMSFSLCRSLTEFTKDLYACPDKVEAAMKAAAPDFIENAIKLCRNNDNNVAFIVLERGSGFYYRLPIFERFEWPFLQQYVDAFISENIIPWLHFDTDWGINLPYLKQLPKGKCVCDLDSATDIFRAKEILNGHMAISGDVPAALLSVGQPEEVEAYCKRLIDEVGDGGGFMLTSGCECPVDVKPENLRAMVDTGLNYRGKAGGARIKSEKAPRHEAEAMAGPLAGIGRALADLKFEEALELTDQALAAGRDPMEILSECQAGMERVGELYGTGAYFLSELIMSADIFQKISSRLEPLLLEGARDSAGAAVVIATPKGDVHDIGKDIVATLFKASGFEVHNLGVDVAPEAIVNKVEETGARIVALSALITPTFQSMKAVVDLLVERRLRDDRFVIIGGGPVTVTVRDFTGADAWTLNPKEGIGMCQDYLAQDRA